MIRMSRGSIVTTNIRFMIHLSTRLVMYIILTIINHLEIKYYISIHVISIVHRIMSTPIIDIAPLGMARDIVIIQNIVHLGIDLIRNHGIEVCYLIFTIIIYTRNIIMSAGYNCINQLRIVIPLPTVFELIINTLPLGIFLCIWLP